MTNSPVNARTALTVDPSNGPRRTRFLMVGGFLGAGKTTAIARIARHFLKRGLHVGIVTNDQAAGLVDTELLRAQGFDVGEVAGACFCCKFDDLVATMATLEAEGRPDILLTEPVGSCTDLVATVIEPLRRLHGDVYEVGPLVVLCKPEHGRRILSGRPAGFSPDAAYIFHKQLEEADWIVVNKIDKLSAEDRDTIIELVGRHFGSERVLAASGKTGEGFDEVLTALLKPAPRRQKPLDIDYDRYADGEAELGWLNARAAVSTAENDRTVDTTFGLDDFVVSLAQRIRLAFESAGEEPAHIKILAACDGGTAVANVVDSTSAAELSVGSGKNAVSADMVINARASIDPKRLAEIVNSATEQEAARHGLVLAWGTVESFRPGRPTPTHRDG